MHLLPQDWIVWMQYCMDFQTICWTSCNMFKCCCKILLCGIGKYDHISATLKSLHWLLVIQRIEFKISVLVYKYLNGVAPQYLCKLLHFYAKDRDLRSAGDKTLLETPQVRTKFGEKAFCYYAPNIWNSLPKRCTVKQINWHLQEKKLSRICLV